MLTLNAPWLRHMAGAALLGVALLASPAWAQRGISSTSSGNDPTLDVAVGRLVNCELRNTSARVNGATSGGAADACFRDGLSGETLAQVQAITSAYNTSNPAWPYELQLLNTLADRLTLGNTVSSGGLFGIVAGGGLTGTGGLGNDHVEMQFLRGAVGSYVMAFSGAYDNGVPGNPLDLWSAYYLFDNVEIKRFGIDAIGSGLMNYKLFENRSRLDPFTGGTDFFRDYTSSLVVNQVSVYELDRVSVVPEPGTWALVLVALASLVTTRRRRVASVARGGPGRPSPVPGRPR